MVRRLSLSRYFHFHHHLPLPYCILICVTASLISWRVMNSEITSLLSNSIQSFKSSTEISSCIALTIHYKSLIVFHWKFKCKIFPKIDHFILWEILFAALNLNERYITPRVILGSYYTIISAGIIFYNPNLRQINRYKNNLFKWSGYLYSLHEIFRSIVSIEALHVEKNSIRLTIKHPLNIFLSESKKNRTEC